MPRSWISMRGPFGTRIGRSFSDKELQRPPKIAEDATLGICRRPDGAMRLAIPNMNGDDEHTIGIVPVAAFFFSRVNDAIEVRSGALLRLGSGVRPDSWISGKSTGQIVQAVQAEAKALGLDPQWARVRIIPGEPGQSGRAWTWADIAVASLFPALLLALVAGMIWTGS
jgi:hypothetical protein